MGDHKQSHTSTPGIEPVPQRWEARGSTSERARQLKKRQLGNTATAKAGQHIIKVWWTNRWTYRQKDRPNGWWHRRNPNGLICLDWWHKSCDNSDDCVQIWIKKFKLVKTKVFEHVPRHQYGC